ncbi:MFS transporter [Hoeflea ulvae]|uniref:MFS transporter n=1 Tax=Hoeflea ulvae TaxID=2983764 RepID=A0ABT3YFB2_9HYPH|nr:MFS transporter [Hoeflea ulvae]MCY0094484.1 MFS transporter [Hoeflea ulvae]
MVQHRLPLVEFPPARAGVNSFAILAACEASARATLISVYPVLMYRALGSAASVSEVYVLIGLTGLVCALCVPLLARFVPRRWLYTLGALIMICGSILGGFFDARYVPFAVAANSVGLVILAVCFNAYVMDYVERASMGRNESRRLLFSGISWSVGPFLGVVLMDWHPQIPFLISIAACLAMLSFFWYLRLGDGKVITKARRPPTNPLRYIPRFFRQPTLVGGWFYATMRSVGWSIYIIYVPIFAVKSGLSDQIGGLALSISNAFLFSTPFMLKFLQKTSVRSAIVTGFAGTGVLFAGAAMLSGFPYPAIAMLVSATVFLVLLDVSGGLPFLLTVKPSERTEMAAVYSTYRDVASVGSPAFARLVLVITPVQGVFAAIGVVLIGCALIARRTHPGLGRRRH